LAERFLRSLKEECLNQLILLSEGALRRAVREYLAHYHAERPHQGTDIGNELFFPDERAEPGRTGKVNKSERLGGLLNFYWRNAA